MNKPQTVSTPHPQTFTGENPFTHPVKELTDEEILQVWKNMPPDNDSGLAFARAIEKRIKEK